MHIELLCFQQLLLLRMIPLNFVCFMGLSWRHLMGDPLPPRHLPSCFFNCCCLSSAFRRISTHVCVDGRLYLSSALANVYICKELVVVSTFLFFFYFLKSIFLYSRWYVQENEKRKVQSEEEISRFIILFFFFSFFFFFGGGGCCRHHLLCEKSACILFFVWSIAFGLSVFLESVQWIQNLATKFLGSLHLYCF